MAKSLEEKIAVMQGFADGKKIESTRKMGEESWCDDPNPCWDWVCYDYRIKEEKKFRPYKNTDELISDFCKRNGVIISDMPKFMLPCIWVKSELSGSKHLITDIGENEIGIDKSKYTLQNLFDYFTFLDGSPCGIKE